MERFLAYEGLWPLALFIAEGRQTLEMHRKMLMSWDSWLARKQPFVALRLYVDEAALALVDGVARETKAWMQAGAAERIREQVAAMTMVVPLTAQQRMKHLNVETIFGIPGGIFGDLPSALGWINENVRDHSAAIPKNCDRHIAFLLNGVSDEPARQATG